MKNKLKINQGFTLIREPYHREHAFTLIEMLVVISLIGILAALGLVSFTSIQKQARDTTRKSDLKQYQNALEVYANLTNGLYPSSGSIPASTTLCGYLNNRLEPDISCSEDSKYSSDNSFVYRYISDGSGGGSITATKYVLWSKVENSSTTKYWVVCSNGKTGEVTSSPSSGTCPV